MSALPYYSGMTQSETNASCMVTPLTSGANDMRLFGQVLDDVAQVGKPLIKLANIMDKSTTATGFVVLPRSSIWMDLSAIAQFRNTATPETSDSGAYLTLLAGRQSGSHTGTASDPLSVLTSAFLDVGPGGYHWYPAATIGRGGTQPAPLFSSRLFMNNIRFSNDSDDSWFVSPGLGIHDFLNSAILTLDAATPKLMMFIRLYNMVNYLISTFTQLVPMTPSNDSRRNADSGLFSGVVFH